MCSTWAARRGAGADVMRGFGATQLAGIEIDEAFAAVASERYDEVVHGSVPEDLSWAEAYASDLRISRLPFRDAIGIGDAADPRPLSRHQPLRDHDGRRPLARALARGCRPLRLPAGTPVILAAGVLKVPTLFGQAGEHIHGQIAVGFVLTGVTAYLSIRFLMRYFETHTLKPFAIYCTIAGGVSLIHFAAL